MEKSVKDYSISGTVNGFDAFQPGNTILRAVPPPIFTVLTNDCSISFSVINPLLFPIDVSQVYKNSLRVYRRICASVCSLPDVLYHHRFRADSIMGAKSIYQNTYSCYEIIKAFTANADTFLSNPKTEEAFRVAIARMLRIFYFRVEVSTDGQTDYTQDLKKDLKRLFKEVHFYQDDEIRNAALNKKKKNRIKQLKMQLYPVLHKLKIK